MKKNTNLISICILAYNRKNDVVKSIHYIRKSNYKNYEIIVVDNGSTDGIDKLLPKKFPEVTYIKNNNEGISGWNVGFKKARGDIILVLDDDSHPSPNTLQKIHHAFSTNKHCMILSCNVINYANKRSVYKLTDESIPKKTFNFMGCGVAIHKNVFKKIGYFAPWIFVYAHETEFSLRALQKKINIWFYPDIIVYHRESPNNRTSTRFIYYCTRNFLIITWIYFPLFLAIPFSIVFFMQSFFVSVKNKQIIVWLKAIYGLISSHNLIRRERNPLSYAVLLPFAIKFIRKK